MTSYNLYNLQDDVLFKSDDDFYQFVELVTGKIEADVLRVQGIRNARCLIRSKDLLAVLKIDCDEINELKPRACFKSKKGEYIVKQGLQLNLDNLSDALKEKHEKYKRKHQRQHEPSTIIETPSTNIENNSLLNHDNGQSIMAGASAADLFPTNTNSSISKYQTATDHIVFIKDLIEKYSHKIFMSTVLKQNEHYDLSVTENDHSFKAVIKCQCGTKIILSTRSDTSTFILSNFYAHLSTTHCSMVNKILKDEEKENAPIEQLESSLHSSSRPESPMSDTSNDTYSPQKRSKRKQLHDTSSTIMLKSKKKTKKN